MMKNFTLKFSLLFSFLNIRRPLEIYSVSDYIFTFVFLYSDHYYHLTSYVDVTRHYNIQCKGKVLQL